MKQLCLSFYSTTHRMWSIHFYPQNHEWQVLPSGTLIYWICVCQQCQQHTKLKLKELWKSLSAKINLLFTRGCVREGSRFCSLLISKALLMVRGLLVLCSSAHCWKTHLVSYNFTLSYHQMIICLKTQGIIVCMCISLCSKKLSVLLWK